MPSQDIFKLSATSIEADTVYFPEHGIQAPLVHVGPDISHYQKDEELVLQSSYPV